MCFSLVFLSPSFCLAVSVSVATLLLSACLFLCLLLSVCVSHYLFLLPSLALSYDKRPVFFTFSLNDAVCKHDLADSAVEALLAVVVISLPLRISVSVGHGLFVSAEDIANENCWDLTGCDTEVISAYFRTCFFCDLFQNVLNLF